MLWPRVRRLGLRVAAALLAIAAASLVSLRVYVHHEIHRATSLLAGASRIKVGDAEATILPLVKRYGGFKWGKLEPLGPRENWPDKDEYDYEYAHEKDLVSDYRYSFVVSPFCVISHDLRWPPSRITQALRATMDNTPVWLRSLFGMRDWGAEVDVAMRDGRVQSVLGMILVEGRTGWLGHEWKLANAMRERQLQARTFVVEGAFLEIGTNSGEMVQDLLMPGASEEEVQVSRKFNAACLTSLRGCDGFCDFVPRTLEYLKQHPNTAGNFTSPRCP